MNTRIKQIRKEAGLNQTEFGNRIGVKQGTVAGYENGLRVPIDAVVMAICEKFNVNKTWLLTGEGEMHQPMTKQQMIADVVTRLQTNDEFLKLSLINVISKADESQLYIILKEIYAELKRNGIYFEEEDL